MSVTNSNAKSAVKTSRKAKNAASASDTVLSAVLAQTEEQHVSLSALVKSPQNVRIVPYSAESVRELADSVKGIGLLQNLVVHALPDGLYGVAAGGRRLAAMNLLATENTIPPDWPVRVKVVPDNLATAASLTENGQHLEMHPAEQIAGFRAMAAEGKTPAQTGDLLGYSPRHVQRMLKLAGLAPVGRAGIDWSDDDTHQASSSSRSSQDVRHGVDAKATQDFKEASDYFTSRKVSESGSHTDNNADSRVDHLSAALNSAKQSYDQYTTNLTRSHEYAEMASRTESMSGQMSEDLSQQFVNFVQKHAPQDAENILTNTSSPEVAERRRAMAWAFVQEQVQPGVDNAWGEARGDIGSGMSTVSGGGDKQDVVADHQAHQATVEQRTRDSNISNDVKNQVDNMVTDYHSDINDTYGNIQGEEKTIDQQYSGLQKQYKTEALSQNNKYNEEKAAQERMPGADSPEELMKRAKEYQDKHKQ